MHSNLTPLMAREHIAELHRQAATQRLVQTTPRFRRARSRARKLVVRLAGAYR
jgi:hypothetical protein